MKSRECANYERHGWMEDAEDPRTFCTHCEIERLQGDVAYERERNATNVRAYSDELEKCTAEVEQLRAASRYRNTHDVRASRIDAALALHGPVHPDIPEGTWCLECESGTVWPCPTVKALKGEA